MDLWILLGIVSLFLGVVLALYGLGRGFLNDSDEPSKGTWVFIILAGVAFIIFGASIVFL